MREYLFVSAKQVPRWLWVKLYSQNSFEHIDGSASNYWEVVVAEDFSELGLFNYLALQIVPPSTEIVTNVCSE